MFLKRAVLHGFKSFADRTEFDFGSGITTIVGPNGCGKSNILDAVRWVLGEQSARSLRGDRMADVIFSGSRSRKPAAFAEVLLTFDNSGGILRSDDAEVVVGRVLYRSGESEYRLNGESCRLKDIRELLLDTGVGKDAYSVIEQGRVDLLLQANPVERREIFEEAAGISRYKVRRIEAQRRLERTEENLLRLRDILGELEHRLRSVRQAAGKARNYQQYDARLRELRAAYVLAEYHELEQARLSTQAEADELLAATQVERAHLAEADATAAELAHALQSQDEAIQAAESRLHELQAQAGALRERISGGQRRVEDLRQTLERRGAQTADASQRLIELGQRIEVEQAAVAELQALEKEQADRLAGLQARRGETETLAAAAKAALDGERVAAFEVVRQESLLQNEQASLQQQDQRLGAQAERLEARAAEIAGQAGALAGRIAALAGEAESLGAREGELAAALREDEKQQADVEQELSHLDVELAGAREARAAASSRLALLEDLERRGEGVCEGAQAVLRWREGAEGSSTVVGLVADLLRIDDPRVGLLQNVLASFEDHVVVRSAGDFLAEWETRGAVAGGVRLVALDRLTAAPMALGYEGTPGFLARASDWVSCASEFRPLAEHLLGRTIVVDTLDRALRLASEALAGYVFITPDGWTVRGDGRWSYGSPAAGAGLISRRTWIRKLRGELEDCESRLVGLGRRRKGLEQSLADVQLRRQERLGQIAGVQRRHAEVTSQRGRLDDERQRLERESGWTQAELQVLRRSREELGQQQQQLAEQCVAVHDAQRDKTSRLDALAAELAEAESRLAELSRACTAALVEQGRSVEKRVAAEAAVGSLRLQLASLERSRGSAEEEARAARGQIAALEQELEEASRSRAEHEAAAARQQGAVIRQREERVQLRSRVEESLAESREVQRRIEAAESVLHERGMSLRETQVRQEGLVARVREELGLELPAQYASYDHAQQDWEAVRQEIEELRGKIARLGNVNLDAIADLEELTPRYEHLVAQRDDLLQSMERLRGLIAELDAESQARFAAAFETVRENFQDLFRKLFGGGKADIFLEEPERPLECGIEIIARPPGKEPQSLSLLSGGEKTMTAVALLMAVFKTRPSPFAILDEVDAALDESNTERFNKLLQEFLSHTQFVVITHSKRTMACADVLYGITMEEPGVSKRVSVRFEDRVQTPNVA